MANQKPADQRPIKDLLREKDAFLTTSEKAHEFFLKHTKGFITAAIVVVVCILGAAIYQSYSKSAEEKARVAFERALETSASGQADQETVIAGLETVRTEYAGRKGSRLAALTLVTLYSERGETDKALALAENFLQTLKDYEISLKPALLSAIGGLYELKKDYPLAIKTYEALLSLDVIDADLKVDTLISLARVNIASGQNEAAIDNYTTILKNHAGTSKALLANIKLTELKGEPQTFPLADLTSPGFPTGPATEAASIDE